MRLDNASGAFPAFRAMVPNGRLFVPPAYYNTGSDTAVQLNSADDWVATKFIAECDWLFDRLALRIKTVASAGNITMELYSHDATNNKPSASLAVMRIISSGSSADVWLEVFFPTNQPQLQRGITYWIVFKGSAAPSDYSLSCGRWNTVVGSAFPDTMLQTKISTDGGSSWSDLTKDSKPAMLNVMLLTAGPGSCVYLSYGQYTGKYIYLPGVGPQEIPSKGVLFNVNNLTTDTLYYVYGYNNSGALALDCATTLPTLNEGILVKTGATTYRYLGMIYPKQTTPATEEAPIDCMDSRLVMNHYNKVPKPLGKLCPYSGATADTGVASSWEGWNGSATEWKFEFLSDGTPIPIHSRATGWTDSGETVYSGIGLDAASLHPGVACGHHYGETNEQAEPLVASGEIIAGPGYHYGLPIQKAGVANQGDLHFEVAGTVYSGVSGVIGTILC